MRIAVLILGLILGAIMFVQTTLVAGLSGVADDQESGGAAAVGMLMALIWLVSCATAIPLPRVAMILFVVAAVLGFAASTNFGDLGVWGGVSIFLAVLSFFGWRGKRKADLKEQARDDWMRTTAEAAGQQPPG